MLPMRSSMNKTSHLFLVCSMLWSDLTYHASLKIHSKTLFNNLGFLVLINMEPSNSPFHSIIRKSHSLAICSLHQNDTICATWTGPPTKISPRRVKSPPTSNTVFATTMDPLLERRSREHLSDIEIAKILALDRVSTSQQEIASLVKTTLQRRRSEAGLGSYVAATKPGLRAENVTKWLEWVWSTRIGLLKIGNASYGRTNRVYGLV